MELYMNKCERTSKRLSELESPILSVHENNVSFIEFKEQMKRQK